ncbi:replicative DNA helicase [Candidatus Arthromitus sp. SFB-mouse-Japan]|uniref:replicative DNA helicase n=1 Tax=unclassified Candidatus Neoarthromitus TaxID=2638829 RepID=UPI00021B81AB|nr:MULTISPECIES: replicative DNA helicase [unclassified Candidatus Arthromitus]EIA22730.1 Replicative DNA helicase [Candidatus Arthromitus sp. SFB-1]EIA26557.1 Replicative DNA helicase [Candidatus Arthromitus sp. SFB-5]EIA28951.1 Replicative DNA helicase [Candidatus Arthromitus sp. SFB-co]EIA29735.1 Replicative DNA helicase [Candidatus Arthromitus sp. SFB-mouse-SU]EIA30307.1 Replicative DNA helicase [Candidatus Arthromitus sp. SFB-4]
MDNKISPNNIESEQTLLGAMIIHKNTIHEILDNINVDDFYKDVHKNIFKTIKKMFLKDIHVDLISLIEYLKKDSLLELSGGALYITDISNSIATIANIQTHIKIVKDNSILRKLIKISNDTLERIYKKEDPNLLIENIQKSVFDLSISETKSDIEPLNNILDRTIKHIENLYVNNLSFVGLSTGFYDLDIKLSGLQKSQMILIAARPSMGKTTFALNIAENVAIKENKTVLIFSLEMSKEQLTSKLISSITKINIQKLQTGNLDDSDLDRLVKGTEIISKAKIYIDDTPNISITEMRSKCRKLKFSTNIDLIIIDYLQLMSGNTRNENRQQEVSEISRFIKALSKEINCPIIALSQLSRAPEQRSDHRPMLSDLRESGSIEQDSDIVMLLYRDEYYNKDTEYKNIAECIIAKHRNGEVGNIKLAWIGQHSKFANLDNKH